MTIKQLSMILENKRGEMAKVTKLLAEKGIDLRAVSLSAANEFGVLRIISSEPEKAFSILSESGMMVQRNEVVAACVSDKPGEFAKAAKLIAEGGVNIEYLYSLANVIDGEAVIVMKFDQPNDGVSVLRKNGFRIIDAKELGG